MRAFRWLRRTVTFHGLRKRMAERRKARHGLREVGRFPKNSQAPRHNLAAPLTVSLTSFPARFHALHLTIKSLMDQSIKPDRIILWIGHNDVRMLPESVKRLEGSLFRIGISEDIRSFTKILPALAEYPESFIVVCDDDLYYPENWLKGLVDAYDPGHPTIVYNRGHRVAYNDNGKLAPYRSWQHDVSDEVAQFPSTDVMPTGVGGVLYPPGSLPGQTNDIGLIRRLSETCDDSWLYFMWRQTGWTAKRVPGESFEIVDWPQTQQRSLRKFHRGGKKDEHLRALSEYFGTP